LTQFGGGWDAAPGPRFSVIRSPAPASRYAAITVARSATSYRTTFRVSVNPFIDFPSEICPTVRSQVRRAVLARYRHVASTRPRLAALSVRAGEAVEDRGLRDFKVRESQDRFYGTPFFFASWLSLHFLWPPKPQVHPATIRIQVVCDPTARSHQPRRKDSSPTTDITTDWEECAAKTLA
jgi:hypothetical protein